MDEAGFETRAIHAGQEPDPATGAIATPIYQTSTFQQEAVGRHLGYEYARTSNPTRAALEACLASLEGARHGFAFASGMAAIDAVLRHLGPGDHLLLPWQGYGGTWRLVTSVLPVAFDAVDQSDLAAMAEAWRPETRMVWVESPTNPTLGIVDIAAVARFAHERGALCVVDNTFATPYLQTPLALGADVVVHSTTKYLGGHSDVIGGFAACNDDGLAASIGLVQRAAGGVPGPFDCFLVLRGVKTLAVRMDRHCRNAAAVVEFLEGHGAVADVRYPGRPSHPGHDVASSQMRGFGGMVAFTLAGGEAAARALVERTRLFALGESLGGVESLVGYPTTMSHAAMAGTSEAVDPALVRLSVGIEDPVDLVADLRQALDGLTGPAG
ncbi:MAG: cystathionine gamma-synthase [Actinomycetota bacterium]|nr:cystathionine gamma-synthase [Actinomycetota bacterium]MEA2843560.1 cystathionine gamma-synthase [Actinomycetota bacterium]